LFDEAFCLNSTMKKKFLFTVFIFLSLLQFCFSQTKLVVLLWIKQTSLFLCKYSFKDSNEGAVANEDGRFYIESVKTYGTLVTSVGF
jgi:hypothetical protein